MTARNAATIASLALVACVTACTGFYEIPIETPISPKMDVSAFQRVLVAGFISGGSDDVDGNLETVRLLRSQLRSKSNLRVIEADDELLVVLVDAFAQLGALFGSGLGNNGSDHLVEDAHLLPPESFFPLLPPP